MLESIYRTHTCGQLNIEDAGKTVVLSGWVDTKRNHGGVMFVDLRDNYGITQIVVDDAETTLKPEDLDKL